MPAVRAVFLAGYMAHLLLDLRWYRQVLTPFFVNGAGWSGRHQRFMAHNTLLTYLDRSAVAALPADAGPTLASVAPDGWLPFASVGDLLSWRDNLVAQLLPGARLRTVEIYAGRMGMSTEEFSSNLDRPEWMERHVFARVPLDSVKNILERTIADCAHMVSEYLTFGK